MATTVGLFRDDRPKRLGDLHKASGHGPVSEALDGALCECRRGGCGGVDDAIRHRAMRVDSRMTSGPK